MDTWGVMQQNDRLIFMGSMVTAIIIVDGGVGGSRGFFVKNIKKSGLAVSLGNG
jgi:hypothetical protein